MFNNSSVRFMYLPKMLSSPFWQIAVCIILARRNIKRADFGQIDFIFLIEKQHLLSPPTALIVHKGGAGISLLDNNRFENFLDTKMAKK